MARGLSNSGENPTRRSGSTTSHIHHAHVHRQNLGTGHSRRTFGTHLPRVTPFGKSRIHRKRLTD